MTEDEMELAERCHTDSCDHVSAYEKALAGLVLAILDAPVHRHERKRSIDLFTPFGKIKKALVEAERVLPECPNGHEWGSCACKGRE